MENLAADMRVGVRLMVLALLVRRCAHSQSAKVVLLQRESVPDVVPDALPLNCSPAVSPLQSTHCPRTKPPEEDPRLMDSCGR